MGQPEFDACKASGGSDETCAVFLGGDDTDTLQQGQILTAADGQRWIAVDTGFGWRLVPEGERTTATSGIKLPPTSTWITETGSLIEVSGSGQILGSRAVPSSQFFGTGGGGTTSFSSTQAAQTQSEQAARDAAIAKAATDLDFLREQERLATLRGDTQAARDLQNQIDILEKQQEFTAEQADIDRELRERSEKLGIARDLVGLRSAEAREARRFGTELAGEDPFKFTAVARGLAGPTGTTPSAAFKQNLAGAAQFQAPDLQGLDTNALESVISKLSQSIAPQQTNPFSFAHGGTVTPGGSPIPGGGSQAIRVGEAGPEILILRPDGSVEVVPEAGSAQEGGVFDLGGFSSLFNRLRGSAGLGGFIQQPGFEGQTIGVNDVLLRSQASRLGAQQRGTGGLFQARTRAGERQGAVFVIDEFGRRRGITPGAASGFDLGDVQFLLPEQLNRIGRGEDIGPGSNFRLPEANTAAFGAFGQPLSTSGGFFDLANALPGFSPQDAERISNLIGFLPTPFKIPAQFFQALLPAEKQALISAYRLAGVSEEDFEHLRTAPQLSFSPQRATAVG